MSFIRYLGAPVAALIVAAAIPSTSHAACQTRPNIVNVARIQEANNLIANSERENLRTAHGNGTCIIIETLHTNGGACRQGMGNSHVTVAELAGTVEQAPTYHVFDYTTANNAYQCTTP